MASAKDDSTPIRRQYLEIKRAHADSIVFFRLGDFYETFDADAELVARELDIVLTSRPVSKDQRIPMAGVPHHAADGYIARLIERGYRVAIAEQIGSEPVNGLVPRAVRRVMTPGTVVEEGMLDANRPSYLAAVLPDSAGACGLAFCDITTGEFQAAQLDSAVELDREMARLQPRETLQPEDPRAPKRTPARASERATGRHPVTPYPAYRFESSAARQVLLDHFQVATLQGFGLDDKPLAQRAAGAIVAYLRETQPAALKQLMALRTYSTAHFMGLDAVSRRNLELTESTRVASGKTARHGASLLGILDATLTPMGARLLRAQVSQPLTERAAIEERLARVDVFFGDALRRATVRDGLKGMPDLERLTARVVSGIATPANLLALRSACIHAQIQATPTPAGCLLALAPHSLAALEAVIALIGAAVRIEPDEEGFVQPGFSAELDEVHAAAYGARSWMANLERVERERSGIRTLKVGYNKVFGYYIEITHANTQKVPDDYHPQTDPGQRRALYHAGSQRIRDVDSERRRAHRRDRTPPVDRDQPGAGRARPRSVRRRARGGAAGCGGRAGRDRRAQQLLPAAF